MKLPWGVEQVMFESKTRYPIAIDMSDDPIYAAQFRKSRKGPVVRGLAHKKRNGYDGDEPDDSETGLISILKDLLKGRCFSGKKAVLHLPHGSISSFPVRVRVEKGQMLEEVILRESKEYISYPLNEAVIDYPSLIPPSTDEKDHYRVTITAIQRDVIHRYLQICKRAGLIVEAIDFDVSSLIRLHGFLCEIPENPVILCNMDRTKILITVITCTGILAERHVSWGFSHLIDRIRSNLELPGPDYQTEGLLSQYGLAHDEYRDGNSNAVDGDITDDSIRLAIYQIITPYIEELIDEFHKMTVYLRSEERDASVEKIYLYGHANSIHGLHCYLEKRLNIPTELVNPATRFAIDEGAGLRDPSEGAPFGLALGLALRRVTWL